MIKVAIIDYGTGNIASLASAINSFNAKAYLAKNLNDIKNADALILPGVGHFGHALKNLKKKCLLKPIIEIVKEGLPSFNRCIDVKHFDVRISMDLRVIYNDCKLVGFRLQSTARDEHSGK